VRRGLIEVLIAGVTVGCSTSSMPVRVKEDQLRATLWNFRAALHEYTFDHQRAPRTLQELLQQDYLREIPVDPMTGSSTTWRIITETPHNAIDKSAPGIVDIKSGSAKTGLNRKRYWEW